MKRTTMILAGAVALGACSLGSESTEEQTTQTTEASGGTEAGSSTTTDTSEATDANDDGSEGSTGGADDDRATITHNFGGYALEPSEEVEPCVQWTLNNEEPVYVQSVTLSNLGFFHHSNWFVVPEESFPGPDGFFNCEDREFLELTAAIEGTVLFAQSTQSYVEEQRTGDGAVIKIPPHSKVLGGTHMLNVTPSAVDTDLWMTFELVHPRAVDALLTAFRLSYLDLEIPAESESTFTGRCAGMAEKYRNLTGKEYDLKIHYALPHFHYLGNLFHAEITGGPNDGTEIVSTVGFDGEANGKTFDPPLDLTGSDGMTFTCGYDNWTDSEVGWGVGDQEMCVMLGLAEADLIMDTTVIKGDAVGMNADGAVEFEGACSTLALDKSPNQSMPTQEEIDGDFYLPPVDPNASDMPPLPECVDSDPSATASLDPTLSNVAAIFTQSCAFNGCHGSAVKAADLDLETRATLHQQLVGRNAMAAPDMLLVDPGNPDGSLLYEKMAQCSPSVGAPMPVNAPILLSEQTVAVVREWIAAGAPAD